MASYCGASHQKIDWSLGEHKQICGTADFDAQKSIGNPKHGVLFYEFELVTEPEEHNETVDDESEEQAEQRRLKDYEKFVAEQSAKGTDDILKDVPDEEFNKYSSQIDEDVVFGKFKKRIDLEKEQVILSGSIHDTWDLMTTSSNKLIAICRFYDSIERETHFGLRTRVVWTRMMCRTVSDAGPSVFSNFR